jgi:hypothetical protein
MRGKVASFDIYNNHLLNPDSTTQTATHMANNKDQSGQYFFRSFSGSSAGSLISGKGQGDGRLSENDLQSEFDNHILQDQAVPTALVSVSTRVIDTLRRAFNKLYKDNESPDQIWIAIFHVPNEDSDKKTHHHAEDLARKGKRRDYKLFRYEYVFEWEIPQKYFVHKVSVQTLRERGFDMEEYLCNREVSRSRNALPPTSILRQEVAKSFLDPTHGGYNIGLDLGNLARCFGARSPVHHIAHQLHHDCSHVLSMDDSTQFAYVLYWEDQIFSLDFEHFRWIDIGIDTALLEWWLEDPDVDEEYREHREWASQIKEEMEIQWDLLREAASDDDFYDGSDIERSSQRLQAEEDQINAEIEAAAVKLGL